MAQLFNTHIAKQDLLASPAAGNVSTANGFHQIANLPPIDVNEYVGFAETAAVAEAVQVITLGQASTPTIAASTVYQLRVGNPRKQREGFNKQLTPIGYTSAAVLSGDAAQDRQNVYQGLASAINNLNSKGGLDMVAYDLVEVAYQAQTSNFAVGETVTGGTSGAQGIVIADADAGATGTLTLGMIGTTQFVDTEALSSPGGGDGTVNGAPTVGVGLRIEDTGGYYNPDPSENLGPSIVLATSGFTAADLVVTQAGVISHGQGADLQQRTEALNSTDNNFTSPAEYGFPAGFLAGNQYALFIIEVDKKLNVDAKTNSGGIKRLRYAVWADENVGDIAGFRAALVAL